MIKLFPRGKLKRRANAYKRLTNSILLGSLEHEKLTNVHVVTLKQYAKDCATKDALADPDNISSYEALAVAVETLLETQYKEAHEFISIEEDRIIVGIDAFVIDDRAADKALLLLVELETFEPGSYHIIGDPVKLS